MISGIKNQKTLKKPTIRSHSKAQTEDPRNAGRSRIGSLLHMFVMIGFGFPDGVVYVDAADRIWQILHAAIGHGAVEEFFVVGAADLDVDLGKTRWQTERTVDLKLARKVVHALLVHKLWQAGIGDDLAVQMVLLAGRDRRAAVENGVWNGTVVLLGFNEGADDAAGDDDVQHDLLQRFAGAMVLQSS